MNQIIIVFDVVFIDRLLILVQFVYKKKVDNSALCNPDSIRFFDILQNHYDFKINNFFDEIP